MIFILLMAGILYHVPLLLHPSAATRCVISSSAGESGEEDRQHQVGKFSPKHALPQNMLPMAYFYIFLVHFSEYYSYGNK
jgi:hypothetical protein